MAQYAATTEVPAARSRDEIERTLTRYGAGAFMYGWDGLAVVIGFRLHDRMIRFRLDMPDADDRAFTATANGRARSSSAAQTAYEQATRQRWRALALVIKAKLEAVDAGISEFETEFLGFIVLPDGRTFGEFARPQIAAVYETGQMPAMLPMLPQTT